MTRPTLEIVVPVRNEQEVLERSITRLHRYTRTALPDLEVRITIADNGSEDLTGVIAMRLADRLPGVRLRKLPERGRGRALRTTWHASESELVAYMDVDLSTDLVALAPLVRSLLRREADIAIGSRLAPGAEVERSLKREVISRVYNLLLRRLLDVHFVDAQCGFKAARRDSILPLLDRVENHSWFFDTELLYLAERAGLAIVELPVRWREDRDSRVNLAATALENLREIRRLRRAQSVERRPPVPQPRRVLGRPAAAGAHATSGASSRPRSSTNSRSS